MGGIAQQVENSGRLLAITQSMAYDGVNRLTGFTEAGTSQSWSLALGYDRYGNRWESGSIPLNMAAVSGQARVDATTNRIVEQYTGGALPPDAYDGDGKLSDHPQIGRMMYDAEGRLKQFTSTMSSVSNYFLRRRGASRAEAVTRWDN